MIAGLDLNEGLNLSKIQQKTRGTFAKYGDPNHDDIAYWPKFFKKDRSEIHWNKYIEVIQKSIKWCYFLSRFVRSFSLGPTFVQ